MNATLDPIIREMHESDLHHVIRIEREIFLFPWSIGNFADSIRSGYFCRVIEEKSELCGYSVMMLGADEAHILTIGIGAQWQKKGLGEKMLKYHIRLADKEHAKSILLDVRESNLGAVKLYKQLGFQQIAKRKGYYPAMCGREDALIMRHML